MTVPFRLSGPQQSVDRWSGRHPVRRCWCAPRPTRATGHLCARPCPTAHETVARDRPWPSGTACVAGHAPCPAESCLRQDSAVGGTSQNGTHRAPPQSTARIDEAVALPSPAVMLSARLDQYYGHLRRPPGWLPLPGSSPVIGHRAPPALRSLLGRGGPLQFPPPLSERSEPPTPGSPSRLHLQDLHRFHGLRLFPTGSALPGPTRLRAGALTTLQASLDVTDRSVAHPAKRDARRWASTPPVSRRHRQPATGPPDSYPDRTCTGK